MAATEWVRSRADLSPCRQEHLEGGLAGHCPRRRTTSMSLIAFSLSSVFSISLLAMGSIGFGMIEQLGGNSTFYCEAWCPDPLRGRVISFYDFFSGFTIFGSHHGRISARVIFLLRRSSPSAEILTIVASGLFWRALPNVRRRISEHGLIPQEKIFPIVTLGSEELSYVSQGHRSWTPSPSI